MFDYTIVDQYIGVKILPPLFFEFLVFLTPETRWFSVGIGSIIHLDNIWILFSLSYQLVVC